MRVNEIIDHSSELLCLCKVTGEIVEKSPIWIHEFSHEDINQLNLFDLIDFSDKVILEKYFLNIIDQSHPSKNNYIDIKLKKSNNRFSWYQISASYIKSEGTFFCIIKEVTMGNLESIIFDSVDSNGIGFWEIDLKTNQLFWSKATHHIHGTDYLTYEPKLENGLNFFPKEALELLVPAVNLLMKEGTPYDLELPFLDINGKNLWINTKAKAILKNGIVQRVFGTFEDISLKRKERNHLELILKNSEIGIWDWDLTTDTVVFNERWCSMLGLDVNKIESNLKTWDERAHPDDKLNAYLDIQDHLAGKTTMYRNIHRMKHADGHWVWILDQGRVSETINGKPTRFSGTHTDISYIKELENEKLNLKDKFKLILEAIRFGVWDWNIETNELKWDDSMYELFGVNQSDFSGEFEAWEKALHPEDLESSKQSLNDSIENGPDFHSSFRIIKNDGEVRHIAAKGFIERNYSGKAIRVTGINWDITEMVKQEKLFDTILKNVPLMITFYNNKGNIEWINKHWTDVLGYSLTDINSIDDISSKLFFTEVDKKRVSNLKTEAPNEWKEILLKTKSGQDIYTSWTNVHLSDGQSIGIGQNIEEQKKQDRLIKEQEAKIISSAKLTSLGEMASGIAHEINNPLAIIQGKASQVLKRLHTNEIDYEYLIKEMTKIETNTQRINKIIKGLRTFSRQGESDPLEIVHFKNILEDVLELCSEKFKYKGVTLNIDKVIDQKIECRPTQIAQVLLNLINNAHDAVAGNENAWVTIETTIDKSIANHIFKINVIDSGSGISQEVAEKIMQPFFTTKDVGVGTGLGLSISKGIIESHKGKLYLDNNSKNTCFVIELPFFN